MFTLARGTISWCSVMQDSLADSTTKAECMTALEALKEGVWFKRFLVELEIVPKATLSLVLYCDNSGAAAYMKFSYKILAP